ncbi:MAG: histidine phosphatase family protein, partial [Deferrisomatales bacterium]
SRLLQEVLTPYQGRPLAETEAVGDDLYAGAGPGFETPEEVARRVLRFVERVRRRYPGGQVAAVTHGDPLAFLLMAVGGLPLDPRRKAGLQRLGITDGYPATGSVTTLTFGAGEGAPRLSYRRRG